MPSLTWWTVDRLSLLCKYRSFPLCGFWQTRCSFSEESGYMEACPRTSKWANKERQPTLWNVTEPPKEGNPDTSYNMDEPWKHSAETLLKGQIQCSNLEERFRLVIIKDTINTESQGLQEDIASRLQFLFRAGMELSGGALASLVSQTSKTQSFHLERVKAPQLYRKQWWASVMNRLNATRLCASNWWQCYL